MLCLRILAHGRPYSRSVSSPSRRMGGYQDLNISPIPSQVSMSDAPLPPMQLHSRILKQKVFIIPTPTNSAPIVSQLRSSPTISSTMVASTVPYTVIIIQFQNSFLMVRASIFISPMNLQHAVQYPTSKSSNPTVRPTLPATLSPSTTVAFSK